MPFKIRYPTVKDVAFQLASGRLHAEDLFYTLKGIIEDLDGSVNSFSYIVRNWDFSIPFGPLYGLPVAVKDVIDTAGMPTEYGSPIFYGHVPDRDAAVVRNIKAAGGMVQGKTSTHEFAMGIVTPQSRNPWDTTRITGGSSGGSAAALAAGFSLFALGTDTAGSIRIPAALCGITGLKPSTGKLSLKGIFPEAWSLDTVGPMCRFASDLPFLLSVMGYGPSACKPLKKPTAAVITNLAEATDHSVRQVFNGFLDKLSSEGLLEVEEISIPELEDISLLDDLIDSAENAAVHRELFHDKPSMYTELSRMQLEYSSGIRASDYIAAQRDRKKYRALFRRIHSRYRFLLSPTSPTVAPRFIDIKDKPPQFFMKYMSYTNPFNFTREPAVSIPIGFEAGMPVGAQISSSWGEDISVCEIASSFQEVSDWHLMFPDAMATHIRKFVDSFNSQ
ncbi:MAG: amidase [Candidatus Micrarchaeaceae archaeon]